MTEYQNPTQAASLKTHVQCDDPAPEDSAPSGSEFMGLHGKNLITDIPPPPLPLSRNSQPSIPSSHEASKRQSLQSTSVQSPSIVESARFSHYSTQSNHGPQFRSALSYTEVRDFAYPEFHPLHYGVPLESDNRSQSFSEEDYDDEEYPDSYLRDGGPPWKEDSDLASPVVISHNVGDRISKEYEFSIASADEIHGRAVALFDFEPENDNEAPLREGQIIWVSYRHGQGWLVAEDPATGEKGLVPEEYVQMIVSHEIADAGLVPGDEEEEEEETEYTREFASTVPVSDIPVDLSNEHFTEPKSQPSGDMQPSINGLPNQHMTTNLDSESGVDEGPLPDGKTLSTISGNQVEALSELFQNAAVGKTK